MRVTTWANGFGVWHVRVDAESTSRLLQARKALRDELTAREKNADPRVWRNPVRVPELDTPGTIVYRERSLTED